MHIKESVPSAYERWTWERCRERILSLKHRLGYGEKLWVLGYQLLDNGCFVDPFHGIEVFNPAQAPDPNSIPYQYSAIPEMYCLLSTYAEATEKPLSGSLLSPNTLDTLRRFQLTDNEIVTLFRYIEKDFNTFKIVSNPFFGEKLGHGDLSFKVWPLPRVPVTLVLWCGDEELGPGGTVMFDRSVTHYLPNLVVELAGLVVWRLRNILDLSVKWGYHQLADP